MLRFGELQIDTELRQVHARNARIAIAGRSFDILVLMAQAKGSVLTKQTLLEGIWPGAGARASTLQVHISALRKALGDHARIRTVSGVGYQLLEEAGVDVLLGNLPVQTLPLIGQESSIGVVSAMLRSHRIVTLTGPGGIGKTRLGLAVAQKLVPIFSDGAWLVQLASLTDGDHVSATLCAALGIDHFGSDLPSDRIAQSLGSKELLILLDNCEHLIGAAANLAEKLVYASRSVRILATSREALAVDGECVYAVPSLDAPPEENEFDLPTMLGHSAVELFLSKLGQERLGYSKDLETLKTVSAICRQLGGIPLAIELAAARVAALGVQEVHERLTDRFNLLNTGRRAALPRQQTLRAALDWSYVLLPDASRTVLTALSVFAADFTLEAARYVISASNLSDVNIVDEITDLVGKCLVEAIGGARQHTYRLLETTRYYALERLVESGHEYTFRTAHAKFHLALAQRRGRDWKFEQRNVWIDEYGCRVDDIRAAIDHCCTTLDNHTLGVELVIASAPVWIQLGLYSECRGHIERVLPFVDPLGGAHASLAAALFAEAGVTTLHVEGPTGKALAYFEKAFEIAHKAGDVSRQLFALQGEVSFFFRAGNTAGLGEVAQRFASVSRAMPTDSNRFLAARLEGLSSYYQGAHADARSQMEAILGTPDKSPNSLRDRFHFDQRCAALSVLARIYWTQGSFDKAMSTVERCLARAREKDHLLTLVHVLCISACPLSLLVGDLEAATRYSGMLLELSTKHGFSSLNAWARYYRGLVNLRNGERASLYTVRNSFDELRRYTRLSRFAEFLQEHIDGSNVDDASLNDYLVREEIDRCVLEGQHWCIPNLIMVRGVFIAESKVVGERGPAAERFFISALETSKSQGALGFSLHAAMRLAKLRTEQGRHADAVGALSPVYSAFSEGFDFPALRQARSVIDAGSSSARLGRRLSGV